MVILADALKIFFGAMKIMDVSQKVKPVQPLQIGNEKLKPKIEWSGWLKLLIKKSFKITINW